MNSAELKRAKRRIRREVLARRDAVPPEEREARAEVATDRFLALPEMAGATTVLAFWSFGSELPTALLLARLEDRGTVVALPRIVDGELEVRSWVAGDPMTTASFGAFEPSGGRPIPPEAIDVVATPAVAFDRRGHRVGYGGGFYDRFLPKTRPDALRAGLGFGLQLVEAPLPAGHFDLRIDVVVTELEVVRCRADEA
jgi:5-formyltetrahydrofolate cyclo-ligase